MKQITKEVARQFFQLGDNKQEMLGADGKAIYPVETYLEIGKIIDLQESDIKQLEKKHISGWDICDSIYSHETGERLEYLVGISNSDFLVWFAEVINADIEGWNETREFMGFERDIRAERLLDRIFSRLQIIADISEEEMDRILEQAS
jgi:hypothetical protein